MGINKKQKSKPKVMNNFVNEKHIKNCIMCGNKNRQNYNKTIKTNKQKEQEKIHNKVKV